MFRFEHIEYFGLLAVIPVLWLLFIVMRVWRSRMLKKFADAPHLAQLAPRISRFKPWLKLTIISAGFVFLAIGLANPQTGGKKQEVKHKGMDLMICLDVSNSMLAEDLSPNRLERAKRGIKQLVEKLNGDRVGVVAFAGRAIVEAPITHDYPMLKLFLENVDTDAVPTQGTAIGQAIQLAMESFNLETGSGKAIVVISDGENHEGDALEATRRATEAGIVVHTIGIGSTSGSPIPVYRGKKKIGHRKDRSGTTVVTSLNESMLQDIARTGNGLYIRATNARSGMETIRQELEKMEKSDRGTTVFMDYEDRFWPFLVIAFALFFLEPILSYRRSLWLSNLFK